MPRLSRKRSKRVKRRTLKRKTLRGGNANVFPLEYFGGDSGRYSELPTPNLPHEAYGDYVGQSHGMPFGLDASGPNMFVSPGQTSIKTGGGRRRTRSRRRRRRRVTRV